MGKKSNVAKSYNYKALRTTLNKKMGKKVMCSKATITRRCNATLKVY